MDSRSNWHAQPFHFARRHRADRRRELDRRIRAGGGFAGRVGQLLAYPIGWSGREPDFAVPPYFGTTPSLDIGPAERESFGPYLSTKEMPSDFAPFAFLRDNFGFVPNLFQVQALCPAAVAAEVEAMRLILLTDDVLKRKQKERILLAVSGSNQNTYCVAVYAEILTLLGVAAEESYQIAADHRQAGLSELDHALLDFAVKLSARPEEFSVEDVESLRRTGTQRRADSGGGSGHGAHSISQYCAAGYRCGPRFRATPVISSGHRQ